MKKITNAAMAMGFLFILNIQRPPVADKASISESVEVPVAKGKSYAVDTAASVLNWTGTKPSGKHTGTIKIKEGTAKVKKSNLVGGSFVFDMGSIADNDMSGKGKEGLEGHLKSADFFDVAKFPTAEFTVTAVSPVTPDQQTQLAGATHNISGNLTLKGITKNVSFPAVVTIDKKTIAATAEFNIDRTAWGINYGSDGKVAKEINLTLKLVANK
jgi:polyisoprenoid-binding protein YceI